MDIHFRTKNFNENIPNTIFCKRFLRFRGAGEGRKIDPIKSTFRLNIGIDRPIVSQTSKTKYLFEKSNIV